MTISKFIAFALGAASLCSAAQSVALKNGLQLTGTLPRSSALGNITDFRYEFRLHGFSQPTDPYAWIFTVGDLNSNGYGIRLLQGTSILDVSDRPDNYATIRLDLSGRTDVMVRIQRDWNNKRLTLEAWNPDGTHYAAVTSALATPAKFSLSGSSVGVGTAATVANLAFLRVYSNILPMGSVPPSSTNGNIGDWEFEGNLRDKSSSGANLSGGTATYVATPNAPIHVTFGQYGSQQVWSVNHESLALDASPTFSSADDPQYTYSWSLVSGPGTGSFSDPNKPVTTFSADTPGDYLIRLTASDGVTTNNLDVDFGAVNTDDKNIVQTGNANMDIALGPLTMWGTSPWPWYDYTEMANADALYSLLTAPPAYGQTPLSGTVSAVAGSQNVVGTGTHFISDVIDCNPTSGSGSAYACSVPGISSLADLTRRDRFFRPDVNCAGGTVTLNINSYGALPITGASCTAGKVYQLYFNTSSFSINSNQPLLWMWWNGPDGPGTGRALYSAVIVDDTHMTLQASWLPPTAQSTAIQYSHPDSTELGLYWNYVGQPSNNLNYYDVVHALYKLYYRTGLTKYQTEARTFADNWFKYGTGQGYSISAPRAIGYLGMIDRAIDGHPAIWAALNAYMSYPWAVNTLFQLTTPQPVGFSFDTREMGYASRFVLRGAALAQTPTGASDAAQRTAYCRSLHNIVANLYSPTLDSIGQWESDQYSANISYPAAKLNGHFGSSPWRDAMSGIALEESYDVLTNSCNDSATAALALNTATKFATNLHDYDQGKSDTGTGVGSFANIQYGSNTYNNIHGYAIYAQGSYVNPLTTGSLSVTAGSPVVTGSGTNFTTIFSKIFHGEPPVRAIDSSFIGIPALSLGSCNQVLPVLSVQSDTQLTLSTPWPCASATAVNGGGFGWVSTPAAANNCGLLGSRAETCEGTPDPSLSHEVHAIWSWLYAKTHNLTFRNWALQSLGNDYGGAAGGPGTITNPDGPFATGATGNFAAALYACTAPDFAPAPCGGVGPLGGLGKSFGFSSGAGNANNALAYLVLGAPDTPGPVRKIGGPLRRKGASH